MIGINENDNIYKTHLKVTQLKFMVEYYLLKSA